MEKKPLHSSTLAWLKIPKSSLIPKEGSLLIFQGCLPVKRKFISWHTSLKEASLAETGKGMARASQPPPFHRVTQNLSGLTWCSLLALVLQIPKTLVESAQKHVTDLGQLPDHSALSPKNILTKLTWTRLFLPIFFCQIYLFSYYIPYWVDTSQFSDKSSELSGSSWEEQALDRSPD